MKKASVTNGNHLEGLLGYVAKSTKLYLNYNKQSSNDLNIWADADWGGPEATDSENQDCASTTGFVLIIGTSVIEFRSCKQKSIARLTVNAEILAAGDAFTSAVWLLDLVAEMKLPLPNTKLHIDSTGAAARVLQKNSIFQTRLDSSSANSSRTRLEFEKSSQVRVFLFILYSSSSNTRNLGPILGRVRV
jgi:hypothetical protein